MPASSTIHESPELRVTLDQLVYQAPAEERPHCFIYYVSIHNDGQSPVTVRGRKWVVRNDKGEVTAVEGEGVVGQTPTILPGEKFSYNSFHLLQGKRAVAEGSYLCIDSKGRRLLARIPPFVLVAPAGEPD